MESEWLTLRPRARAQVRCLALSTLALLPPVLDYHKLYPFRRQVIVNALIMSSTATRGSCPAQQREDHVLNSIVMTMSRTASRCSAGLAAASVGMMLEPLPVQMRACSLGLLTAGCRAGYHGSGGRVERSQAMHPCPRCCVP
eukprot:2285564-Rhodomonas_salina.4